MKLLAGGALVITGGLLAVGIFTGGFLAGIALMHSAHESEEKPEVTP